MAYRRLIHLKLRKNVKITEKFDEKLYFSEILRKIYPLSHNVSLLERGRCIQTKFKMKHE